MNEKLNIGIDLGTTFSSIAAWNINHKLPELLKTPQDQTTIPSYISLSEMTGNGMIVGQRAKNDIESECIIFDSKRILGRTFVKIDKKDIEMWPFDVKDDGRPYIVVRNPLNEQGYERFEPEEVSGIILRYLMNVFRMRKPDYSIGEIVVTVPADFTDEQRKATKTACNLAGIPNITLLNEPSAAILEYKRVMSRSISIGSKIVVIDFGGGTLDVNCCIMGENDEVKVVSTGGDQNLGGNNFDQAMMNVIKNELIKELKQFNFFF